MSQCDQVLQMLMEGAEVTPATVYAATGSLACHSRIAELRDQGYAIACKVMRQGKKKWGSYSLVPQTEAVAK